MKGNRVHLPCKSYFQGNPHQVLFSSLPTLPVLEISGGSGYCQLRQAHFPFVESHSGFSRIFIPPTDFRPTFEAKLSAGKLGTMPKNNLSDYLEHNANFLTNHPLFVLLRALTTQFWYSIREVFNSRCCSFHSTTEIRWRGGEERVQWRTDREENTKKHVKQSKIESINVPNPTVTFILVAAAVLFSLVTYLFIHWFSAG